MNKKPHLHAAIALLCTLVLASCTATPVIAPTATAAPTASPAAVATSAPASATADAQTPAPTDTPAASPQVVGLMLVTPVLTDNVTTVSNTVQKDGTYREELLFDGMVSIVNERLASIKYSQEALTQQIASLNGTDAKDIKIAQDDTISKKLTYPAWRITYTTGSNEDTRQNVDIYVQADGWDFRFHTSTPADSFDDYKDSIESWFESFDMFDSK